jgi:hypothetical protein
MPDNFNAYWYGCVFVNFGFAISKQLYTPRALMSSAISMIKTYMLSIDLLFRELFP